MRKRLAGCIISLLAGIGMLFTPAVTAPAFAGSTVTICDSVRSRTDAYGTFRVIDSDRGYSFVLHAGQCVTVANTSTLKVDRFGGTIASSWAVTTTTVFGSCHWETWSNPGSADRYAYKVPC